MSFSGHFQGALSSSLGGLTAGNTGGLQMLPPHPRLPVSGEMAGPGLPPSWAYNHPALTPIDPQTESLAENWRQFQQAAYTYNLDPHILALYGQGLAVGGPHRDLGPRRKNATRETTSILKAWLNEHKKNPYPTKGEKIMLAIITTMTLTQVSTWFANARRRLKKENKMTWVPRNRSDDEAGRDDDDLAVVDDDTDDLEIEIKEETDHEKEDQKNNNSSCSSNKEDNDNSFTKSNEPSDAKHISLPPLKRYRNIAEEDGQHDKTVEECSKKPRIWSIMDTLNKNEPPKLSRVTPPATRMPPSSMIPSLSSSFNPLMATAGPNFPRLPPGLHHPSALLPPFSLYSPHMQAAAVAAAAAHHHLGGAPFHPFNSFGRLQSQLAAAAAAAAGASPPHFSNNNSSANSSGSSGISINLRPNQSPSAGERSPSP